MFLPRENLRVVDIKIAGQDADDLIDKVERMVVSEIETTAEVKSH